jgi:uncharacterized protein (DUF1778 family)
VSAGLKSTRGGRRKASARLNLRIDPQLKVMLSKAAAAKDLELTEFMLNASRVAAEIALADRTRFSLPASKWRKFNAALDARPREIPALRRLFREKSIFVGQ